MPPGGINSANFLSNDFINPNNGLTDVGAFIDTTSAFGAYDMAGNVLEWTEEIVNANERRLRGGSFGDWAIVQQADYIGYENLPTLEDNTVGFRIVSLQAIPEPSTWAFLAGSLAIATVVIRRRRHGKR